MCADSEKDGAQFAQANDMRITRVGKFIRKTRLDEIPQFINVLKGDMSIIGPWSKTDNSSQEHRLMELQS